MTESQQTFIRKWGMLGVLSLALAIIIIDTTLLNVSLGNIIRDLHTDIQSLQWVITAYALMLAAFTITGGRLGDLFGRKRMFLLGAIIFAIGSFIASISTNISTLVWGEAIIEGIGAVLMLPATASMLVANFRGKDRAIAFGVWGSIAAASAAIGPILGGFLTSHYSWRWGFRINVFVGALVLLTSFLLVESRDTVEKKELDVLGILLSSLGLLSLVFGIIESETYGLLQAKKIFAIAGHAIDLGNVSIVLPSLMIGAILLTIFVWWEVVREKRGHTPLVSMNLFENRQFTSGTILTAIMGLGQAGVFFIFPIYFQAVKGLDAFHTGLALLPMPIAIFILAGLSTAIGGKLSPKRWIQIGFIVNLAAIILLRQLLRVDTTVWGLAPGFFLYGMGFGMIMPHLSNLTLSAVSVEQAGEASGVNNMVRQVGASFGSAIVGAVLLTGLAANLVSGIEASSIIPAQAKDQIAQAVSEQTSNVEFAGGAMLSNKVSPQIRDEILKIGKQATTDANKTAMVYAGVFVILALAASGMLPKEMRAAHEPGAQAASGH